MPITGFIAEQIVVVPRQVEALMLQGKGASIIQIFNGTYLLMCG